MVLIKEFRIPLPLSVDEYHIGQLYSVAEASKNETGGGDGVEVLRNEPYHDDPALGSGQYTHKIYHLSRKVPAFIRMLAPNGALELHEEAWNGYPYCKTVLTNDYMKDNFHITIESRHCNNDYGTQDNVHQLSPELLRKRDVVFVNIADPAFDGPSKDYRRHEDPKHFRSEKTGRGPLADMEWFKASQPIMCCYKLVTVEFKWRGLQGNVESFIQKTEHNLLAKFHRQVFCWLDRYHGLTIEDIRRIEDETKKDLDDTRNKGELRTGL